LQICIFNLSSTAGAQENITSQNVQNIMASPSEV